MAWGDSAEVMQRASGARPARCGDLWPGPGMGLAADQRRTGPKGRGAASTIRPQDGWELNFYSPLAGEHNALNTLACVMAMLSAGGVPAGRGLRGAKAGFGRACKPPPGGAGHGRKRGGGGRFRPSPHGRAPRPPRRWPASACPAGRPADGRLVAVFEPRTNTSKTKRFQAEYAEAFDGASLVFLREPPGVDDLPPEERFSSAQLARDLTSKGISAWAHPDADALLKALLEALRPGDLCLIMSNGGFEGLHGRLLSSLD